jgi:hypothetical protein
MPAWGGARGHPLEVAWAVDLPDLFPPARPGSLPALLSLAYAYWTIPQEDQQAMSFHAQGDFLQVLIP